LGARANWTCERASNCTEFNIPVSKGLLTATCSVPFWKSVGNAKYWKATLVEILFRASVGTLSFFRSTNGHFSTSAN
jgi:hypothetical protein